MIILVRHAESAANAGHRTSDPGSIPLTDAGVRQAELLAAAWIGIPAKIISSPFRRAISTAEPLANRFRLPIHIAAIHEFTYLSPDRCRDTTPGERQHWVEAFWQRAEPDFRDGNGAETFREFADRVAMAIRTLFVAAPPGTVIFCHGQFIQMVGWLRRRNDGVIDTRAMREFRELDAGFPVAHCEQSPFEGF